MNLVGVQSEMQEDRLWSLCPVHDTDTVLTNRYAGAKETLSLLYCDLYLRQFKETLKHTMLEQESVFEDQIHELHRLYQRQKQLMVEMEATDNLYSQHRDLFLNAGVSSPRRSIHWMNSSISISKNSVLVAEDVSAKIDEAEFSGDESDKSGEKVLDLAGFSKFECILDLNEPAKIEKRSDDELNQFLSPAQTRSERAEPEAQDSQISTESQAENGIELNISPLGCEEVTTIKAIDSEQPREFISASLHGEHESEPSRSIVQALPCWEHISLFQNRSSWGRKKAKPKRTTVETFPRSKAQRGSNLDSNFGVNEDDNHNPEHLEKGSASSLPEVKSARSRTNPGKRRLCKPQTQSGKVMRKIARTKSKTRGSLLVTEEEEQEQSAAAEAIIDMSLSESGRKSSIDCITPLHWFAKIASSVVEDSKSKVGLSATGFQSNYQTDYFVAKTLQLSEMKPKKRRTNISVSTNIVHPKHKRTLRSQGKRQQQQQHHEDQQNKILQSLRTFTGNEASQELSKIGRLIKTSETNDAHSSLMESMIIDWGIVGKRRRGIRIPASNPKTSIAFLRNQ